ncbi:hypothetical protein ACH5RR_003419 [Cinchona calisaya]|uniref:Uncharacterized protein n=1 Tax=Cinchona calisaya TaxID=153742 RepID=A0ABD3AUX7_9GENT
MGLEMTTSHCRETDWKRRRDFGVVVSDSTDDCSRDESPGIVVDWLMIEVKLAFQPFQCYSQQLQHHLKNPATCGVVNFRFLDTAKGGVSSFRSRPDGLKELKKMKLLSLKQNFGFRYGICPFTSCLMMLVVNKTNEEGIVGETCNKDRGGMSLDKKELFEKLKKDPREGGNGRCNIISGKQKKSNQVNNLLSGQELITYKEGGTLEYQGSESSISNGGGTNMEGNSKRGMVGWRKIIGIGTVYVMRWRLQKLSLE